MLDFRIETFLCVCRHMNYTKAAEELRITQPGVSQHIRCLEEYYGTALFSYSGRALSLTPAGEALKTAMLSVKHDILHLKSGMAEMTEAKISLLFGATLTIGEFFLPRRVARYMLGNPSVNIGMTVGNTKDLLKLLDEGKIDFALLEGYFPRNEYESRLISEENYIAVCGRDYPLGNIKEFSDLFESRLLIRESGSGTREVLKHYLSEHGYSVSDFREISEVNNICALKQMAAAGCGISFIYEIAVREELERGVLKRVELPGWPLSHEFRFVWRKDSIYQDFYEKMYEEICRAELPDDNTRLVPHNMVKL